MAAAAGGGGDAPKPKLGHRFLGKSGLAVSVLGFGTMTFGKKGTLMGGCSEEESHALLDTYVAAGGNHIDTADGYTGGESEEIVGRWLAKQPEALRNEIVLATKLGFPKGSTPNVRGTGRKWVNAAVNASLKRLNTDYIDLLYIHVVDTSVDVDRVVMTFRDLIASGKIHHWGLSNFAGYQIAKLLAACDRLACPRPVCVQAQYSLLCRSTEWEVLKVCEEEGLGVVPWSPLSGGLLSGKYSRPGAGAEADAETGRLGAWAAAGGTGNNLPKIEDASHYAWDVIDQVKAIAEEKKQSCATMALRWILDQKHSPVSSILVGAKKMAHLEDNLKAGYAGDAAPRLTEAEVKELDDKSAIEAPYPYSFMNMGKRKLEE